MRRGFKEWCENISVRYRKELELPRQAPLNPYQFAKHLKVRLITPDNLENLTVETREILLQEDSAAWSAITLNNMGRYIIIYNSSHAPQRQSSDIMHELSHIIIGHKEQRIFHSKDLNVVIRDFNSEHEDEANWLAATLLLPRDALLHIKYRGLSCQTVAKDYLVSISMFNMRLKISGVNAIIRRSAEKYS